MSTDPVGPFENIQILYRFFVPIFVDNLGHQKTKLPVEIGYLQPPPPYSKKNLKFVRT